MRKKDEVECVLPIAYIFATRF